MTLETVTLLLVDDLPENLVALEALVRGPGRRVLRAGSGEEALDLMLEHEVALAILDVQMPGMDGYELAELMRGTARTRHIPIVFVTAAGTGPGAAFRGYDAGAVDFLPKPLEPRIVRSKVDVFVDLARQRLHLERVQAELQRAVRMRDDFMSMISHELRNPLNSLFLQVQLRRRMADSGQIPPLETFRQMVERDEKQVRSMVRLLDDILDVARARTGRLSMQPGPMDLAQVARRCVESMAEPARAAGVQLGLQAPDSLPYVGDAQRLEQVLLNLLTNALRYGAAQPVEVVLRSHDGEACLSVRDHGPGIAPDDQDRIFGQFERAAGTEGTPGLGLGLYISRQIVQAHGGRLALRSSPGAGAEFMVCLPLPAGPA